MTKKDTAKRPKADGTLTKDEFEQALTDAGRVPLLVWSGGHGTTVRGPYHRLHTDKDDKVTAVRSFYRITFEEPIGSGRRVFRERRTKTLAEAAARTIDGQLGVGLTSKEAPRRFESVDTLIDEYLKPANHLNSWNSDRTVKGPTTFLDVWARPVIGHLACIEWDSIGSERILEQMAKCQLARSYRSQGYTYLSALATFARMRRHGFLPQYADPLAEVSRPNRGWTGRRAALISPTMQLSPGLRKRATGRRPRRRSRWEAVDSRRIYPFQRGRPAGSLWSL